MEILEAVRSMIKELVVPELDMIKDESRDIKSRLDLTNKRLDDINLHLADQSRRIDAVREELGKRIDATNDRIDAAREELGKRIDTTNTRIDGTNKRMDQLFDVVVRREDHFKVEQRVTALERDLRELKEKVAA